MLNSLEVNSYEILYYSKVMQGRSCTCSHSTQTDAWGLDEQGNATPEQIASMLSPNGSYGIADYQSSGNSPKPLIGNRVSPDIHIQDEPNESQIGDGFEANTFSMDQLMSAPHTDSGSVACGVCLGAGLVPGFNLFGGERIILDAQVVKYSRNTQINREVFPNSFTYVNGGWVDFELTIPFSVHSVICVRLMNNLAPAQGFVSLIEGSVEESLTPNSILHYKGGTYKIRVRPLEEFTHVEIVWNYLSTPIRADYPNFDIINNLQVLAGEENVSLELGPNLPECKPYDLILDPTFQKLWRVVSVRTRFTREQELLGWECQGRLVQPYETIAGVYMPPGAVDPKTSGTTQQAGGY